ncbi:hypothetical protein BDK51DRAFT_38745 [Blyttiomyces helicus]|uniref:Uncharacterized protein n=1 Tax=Blyttiomyces helicus TaxID=388810 RepID=A0A4P9W7D6_9FUNG|nr:hypothetical protein BDK51DRAFT_38745 [Blyttiomyces helicus]|eukprot:RKO87313.1 hypothetical protein BDK51DRAFT_38745 [Blyttiomyces helicus]
MGHDRTYDDGGERDGGRSCGEHDNGEGVNRLLDERRELERKGAGRGVGGCRELMAGSSAEALMTLIGVRQALRLPTFQGGLEGSDVLDKEMTPYRTPSRNAIFHEFKLRSARLRQLHGAYIGEFPTLPYFFLLDHRDALERCAAGGVCNCPEQCGRHLSDKLCWTRYGSRAQSHLTLSTLHDKDCRLQPHEAAMVVQGFDHVEGHLDDRDYICPSSPPTRERLTHALIESWKSLSGCGLVARGRFQLWEIHPRDMSRLSMPFKLERTAPPAIHAAPSLPVQMGTELDKLILGNTPINELVAD